VTSPNLAAGLLVLGAAGAVAAAAWTAQGGPAHAQPEPACAALSGLVDSLDLASISDQAVVRARAAALADTLSGAGTATEGLRTGEAALAARRVLAVLEDPAATVPDLVSVLGPVAGACGIELPADPG
jgi:hypothetical protein